MPDAPTVTVAIPVKDGAATLDGVLGAVRAQRTDRRLQLLVCDSGSADGSLDIARRHDAEVLEIEPGSFAHGPVRNLLLEHAEGEYVALLTQDAEPAGADWLEGLLSGFALADDVALTYGPYRARPHARPRTRRELERWFHSLSPDGAPVIERLAPGERERPGAELLGRRTFFTDANGCVRRAAWQQVPFRAVAYAEDQALALDLMRAGYAKVYMPGAAVWHSHEYTAREYLRRSFDEWRGLHDVYGWREPLSPRRAALQVRGELRAEWRDLRASGTSGPASAANLASAAGQQLARLAGSQAGSRADRLPRWLRRRLSLEGRDEQVPTPRLVSPSKAPHEQPVR